MLIEVSKAGAKAPIALLSMNSFAEIYEPDDRELDKIIASLAKKRSAGFNGMNLKLRLN